MPNIEFHGYSKDRVGVVYDRVFEALYNLPDADEIVTTTCSTQVKNLSGEKMPFLRVVATQEELPELIRRLKPLQEDIETMLLHQWLPGKKEG